MKTSPKGIALIKSSEGCKLQAYRCSAGVLTIGYGHTGPDVYEGLTITQKEADSLLRVDLGRFELCVNAKCPTASQSQFDAMVCLAYNIGEAAFKRSSVARLHNAGKYAEAAQAFGLWNKAGGKVSAGLVKRRAKEADRYDDDMPDSVAEVGLPQAVDGEKPLSQSRAIKGQVIAGAGTAATAAVNMLSEAPPPVTPEPVSILDSGATVIRTAAEHESLLGQIMPLIQQYWWVFAVVAAAGIAYSLYARSHDRMTGRA